MKIKRFLGMAVAMAVSVCCMTSCGEDEEDDVVTDVREQAVGSYTSSITLYLEQDDKLVDITSQIDEDNNLGTSTVTLSGNNGIDLNIDGDKITISKIQGASNGFCGDIEGTYDFDGVKVEGYKGAQINATGSTTEKYDAVYLTATKTLSVYMKTALSNYINDEDIEGLASFLDITVEELNSLGVSGKANIVFCITSVKK